MSQGQHTQAEDGSTPMAAADAAAAAAAAPAPDRPAPGASGPVAPGPEAETAAATESFSELLAQSAAPGRDVEVGDKVSGVVVKIEGENAFIDFGGRSEAVIRVAELRDADGRLEYGVGDPLEAFVATAQDEVTLTRRLAARDGQSDMLYQAFRAGMPVEGRVDAVNKWGLGITIQGTVRAFCPISQVDSNFAGNPEDYRGKTMTFRITEYRNQGRNVVVSRRALLEAEQAKAVTEVREKLTKGAQVEGTVTRLESFGAFVDLGGGVEGLVHVSELSHKRVEHPQEILSVGQRIQVEVLRTKDLGKKRSERISLSLRALEKDPWAELVQQFSEGSVVDGKVEALEDFGAFVELAPGVRGLVHVSEIAERRLAHPREELSVGQQVKVVVLEADSRRRRLRLSIKQVESMESAANLRDFQARRKQETEAAPPGSAMADALRRANLID